jgi:NAD(P)-dependent dehydrogenase (short-subunit alcohol dehydrogenase family)
MAAARLEIEMETNYFGTLAMCREFAPVLARQGGGVLVNILSTASWMTWPWIGSGLLLRQQNERSDRRAFIAELMGVGRNPVRIDRRTTRRKALVGLG